MWFGGIRAPTDLPSVPQATYYRMYICIKRVHIVICVCILLVHIVSCICIMILYIVICICIMLVHIVEENCRRNFGRRQIVPQAPYYRICIMFLYIAKSNRFTITDEFAGFV